MLWKTTNGGESWKQISPDLTRKTWESPKSDRHVPRPARARKPTQRGVIYTVAPSHARHQPIWAGTDDGLIHDDRATAAHWNDVTPPALTPWSKVSIIDAGRFDAATAYAAINTLRLDDLRPHIYRTHDGGKTWTEITNGIPDGGTGQRGARGSEAQGPALRRHRARRSTCRSTTATTGSRCG